MPAVSHYYDDDKTVCPSVCMPLDCVFFCYQVPLLSYPLRLAGSEPHSLLRDGGVREMAVVELGYKMIHNVQNFLFDEIL